MLPHLTHSVQFTVIVCTKVICCPLLNKTLRNNHYIANLNSHHHHMTKNLSTIVSSRTLHSIDRGYKEVLVAFIQ